MCNENVLELDNIPQKRNLTMGVTLVVFLGESKSSVMMCFPTSPPGITTTLENLAHYDLRPMPTVGPKARAESFSCWEGV